MKTQDIGYVLQKVQSDKKVVNNFTKKLFIEFYFYEFNLVVIILLLFNAENWKVDCDSAFSW